MLRLCLRFPGETLLCLAEITHTSSERSRVGSAHSSFSPIPAALRPVMVFLHLRLLWPLRRPPTTSTAAYPAPFRGGWVGPPTFAVCYSAPKGRSLLYARPLSPDSAASDRWLIPLLAIVSSPRPTGFSSASVRHADYSLASTPSPSFARVLTLWALLSEISCVTLLRLRLAALGS